MRYVTLHLPLKSIDLGNNKAKINHCETAAGGGSILRSCPYVRTLRAACGRGHAQGHTLHAAGGGDPFVRTLRAAGGCM